MVVLLPWKPWPFKLEVQNNTCSALIIQIIQLKQNFFNHSSRTLILATCHSSIQSYFKIDLDLTMLFNVYFLYRKSETFRTLTKNCPKLDKDKSIVSRFSVFVVYKSAVSTIQKKQLCRMFHFSSVNVCICTSIS